MGGIARAAAASVALVAALTAQYLAQTAVVGRASALVVGAAVSLGALAWASLAGGLPRREAVASLGGRRIALAVSAGLCGLLLAPLLVAANRHTDAPSGSEVLFFAVACWGAQLALAGLREGGATRAHAAAGALTALTGTAALLASWEFPSSFSPLVKFPSQEVAMLGAGALWTWFAVVVGAPGSAADRRTTLWLAAASAAAAGVTAALAWAPSTLSSLSAAPAELAVVAVAGGGAAVAWARVSGDLGISRAGALFFAPVVLLTAFSAFVAAGGQPMLLPRAGAAAGVVLAGMAVSLSDRGSVPRAAAGGPWLRRAPVVLAAAAALAAAWGLASPAVWASVDAHLADGSAFGANWPLSGWESAGGWLALCAAVWLAVARRGPFRAAAAGIVCAGAYPLLAGVPLHTWNRWLPAYVQQNYGTEYAHLTFEAAFAPASVAAVAIAVAGLVLASAAVAARARSRREDPT